MYPLPTAFPGMRMDPYLNRPKTNRMSIVKRSLKLNMKKDDARTLMLKMDARLMFGGRERHASFKQETERELKHIEATHQLTNAELNRARLDVERRFHFYQELKKQNKERRRNREIAWCLEEERDWELEAVREARRQRRLPKIEVRQNYQAEVVESIRRAQKKELANKMTHEKRINRSLDALNKSYVRHKALAEQNEAVLEQVAADANCGETKTNTGISEDDPMPKGHPAIPKARKTYITKLTAGKLSVNRPENKSSSGPVILQVDPLTTQSVKQECPFHATSSKKFTESFPMHTNKNNVEDTSDPTPDQFLKSPTSSPTRRTHRWQSVHTTGLHDGASVRSHYGHPLRPNLSPTPPKRKISLSILPQTIPNRFYETGDNPFLKNDALPSIVSRSNDLMNADRPDAMFEWLGFESKHELENLRAAGMATESDGDDGVLSANYNTGLPNVEPDTRSVIPAQKDAEIL